MRELQTLHPHITCFAIDIAKDFILLSCRLAMEHLCVLQLETALATLVTTWFTLAGLTWKNNLRIYNPYKFANFF
jgi:hypothetical protein